MTTPAFNPISTLFNSVRLYTQFDPYYYTVDNRPLNDMLNNNSTMSEGIDAARLSTLLNSLNSDLIDTAANSNSYNVMFGLSPTSPSNLVLKIGVGAVYMPLAVNNSISQTILKKAFLQEPVDLAYTAPVTLGQSVVYTVEARYVDVSASTTNSNFVDSGNSVQFDTCLDGILELQLVTGTAAATGTEAVPATTSGWVPLYNFHVAYGASTYSKIYSHASAPRLYVGSGLKKELSISLPAASAGTVVTTLDPIPSWQLADGADQSLVSSFEVSGVQINSFRKVQFDLEYTSSVNTGNFAVAVGYCVLKEGETMSGVSFTTPVSYEVLSPPATANYLTTVTLAGTIPGEALQNAKRIVVKLTRLGSTQPGADTSTGNMLVTGVVAKQV